MGECLGKERGRMGRLRQGYGRRIEGPASTTNYPTNSLAWVLRDRESMYREEGVRELEREIR